MTSATLAQAPTLVRALGRRDIIGILLNAMIGSGMLAAPAKVYAGAGGWSFLVLMASALVMVPLVLCFADLGSRFSGTGGPYLYARSALPPAAAFSVGWLLWFSQAMSAATLCNLMISYLAGFAPALAQGWPRMAAILALGLVLATIALVGIRESARVSNLLIVIKVGFVAVFLVAGLAFIDVGHLKPTTALPAVPQFATAMLIYLFAYSGFERGAVIAGEAREPKRDVPIALAASVAIATLAYGAVLLVCVGILDAPAATDRPLAEAGRQIFGGPGAVAVSAGALAVIVGTVLIIVVAMPRMLMALAEQNQLPAFFSKIHPRWRTPHVAILTSSTLCFGLAIVSDLITALTIATATRVVSYILCCVALARLNGRVDAPQPQFRLPFAGIVAGLTALLFSVVLVIGARKELLPLIVVTAVGLVILLVHTQNRRARMAAS
ncbi:MAG: APC family permease [Phenylobacterium sp.]